MDSRIYLQDDSGDPPFLMPGVRHVLTYQGEIAYKNGQGASSTEAHSFEGWKPPALTFTCLIPWRKPSPREAPTRNGEAALEFLQDLHQRSKKHAGTEPVVYQIHHPLAQAMKVFKVQFFGELQIEQAQDLRAWQVSAQWIAQDGVPGRLEARSPPPPGAGSSAGASTTTARAGSSAGGGSSADQPPQAEYTLELSPELLLLEKYSGKLLKLIYGDEKKE